MGFFWRRKMAEEMVPEVGAAKELEGGRAWEEDS